MMYIVRFLLLTILLTPLIRPQGAEGKTGVELPDFVVTGKEAVDFTPLAKDKPPLVPSLSAEFLAPQVSPAELRIRELSDPVRQGAAVLSPDTFYTSRVQASAGNISVPAVSLSWGMLLPNTFFTVKAAAENRRAYIPNADGFTVSPGIAFLFYNPAEAAFLPGMKIGADAGINLSSYKLYASATPEVKRTITDINILPQILVPLTNDFFFTAATEISRFNLKEDGFTQNLLALKGTLRYSGSWLLIKANAEAGTYAISNTAGKRYLRVEGTGGFWVSDIMFFSGGIQVVQIGSINKTNPTASLRVNFTRAVVAEFFMDRFAALLDNRWFYNRNRYLQAPLTEPMLLQRDISLGGMLSYEMERVFEVHARASYTKYRSFGFISNHPSLTGYFTASSVKASGLESQVSILSIPGRYGWFAGTAAFRFLKSEQGNRVPGEPLFTIDAAYGYPLGSGITVQPAVQFMPDVYVNTANTVELPAALNLSISAWWNAGAGTELLLTAANLLNTSRYYAYGYKLPGITLEAGVRARW